MARIVLGIGSSHSPLLNSPPEDYPRHAEIDAGGRPLVDADGNKRTYGELMELAGPRMADEIRPEVLEERHERCNADIARVAETIRAAKLDALIIIGDDQHEQYFEDNMPSILVYWGDTIVNNPLPLPEDAPEFWKRARSQYHTKDGSREYPVDSKLALHVINDFMDRGIDVSQARKLARAHGEGHAFGFVHERLMQGRDVVPIVPVALNTYFPPNQPRPRRCYEIGRALRAAVESYPGDARIGVFASGGLSHFTVNEALDRKLLDAFKRRDAEALCSIPVNQLTTGTSEVRNWLVVAGAVEHLETQWQDYVPCYRSLAGTGCGMGFAIWS